MAIGIHYIGDDNANPSISGTADDDIMEGRGGDDWLSAGDGDDSLDGGSGNDTLYGGIGADTLVGGAGLDLLDGGLGDDLYYVFDGATVVEAADGGADSIRCGQNTYTMADNVENLTCLPFLGAYNITGNDLNNWITGTDLAPDTLDGGDGDDTLDGQGSLVGGVDMLSGGNGDDHIAVHSIDDIVSGGDGIDTVIGYLAAYILPGDVEYFIGATGENTSIEGNGLDNLLVTQSGNDTLIGGAGDDTMNGGLGDDTYSVLQAGDVVTDSGGNDRVFTTLTNYTLQDGIERLTGWTQDQTLTGNAGNNRIVGGGGADSLVGAFGNDTLTGDGDDTLVGGSGYDLYIATASDTIIEDPNEGFDAVFTAEATYQLGDNVEGLLGLGGTGQFLRGNDLDNLIDGGAGDDTMVGGLGDDFYVVSDAGDQVVETYNEGYDIVGTTLSDYTLADGVEDLWGATASQVLTGNFDSNYILGWGGDDTLDGGFGADVLWGGKGNDVYYADRYDLIAEGKGGRGGVDEVRTFESTFELPDALFRKVDPAIAAKLPAAEIENLTFLGKGDFTGTGNTLDNQITSGFGDDILRGLDGDDTLVGFGGEDLLDGGDGKDLLLGGNGDDTLRGGLGNDYLDGHVGDDRLIGGGGMDSLEGYGGYDTFVINRLSTGPVISVTTIVDLTAKDTIDISQLDADTLTSGNQAFHLVDAFTGQAGELLVKYHAGADTTFIQGDVDGDGVADVTIKVWGDHADFSGFVL